MRNINYAISNLIVWLELLLLYTSSTLPVPIVVFIKRDIALSIKHGVLLEHHYTCSQIEVKLEIWHL